MNIKRGNPIACKPPSETDLPSWREGELLWQVDLGCYSSF